MKPVEMAIFFLCIIGLLLIVYFIIKLKRQEKKAKDEAANKIKDAEEQKKKIIIKAKDEAYQIRKDAEQRAREIKNDAKDVERRCLERERNIDKREELLQNRENLCDEKDEKLIDKQKEIQDEYTKLQKMKEEELTRLSKIANISKEDAKKEILERVEEELEGEIAELVREREEDAINNVDKKAREVLVTSMNRYAADVTSENTITVVNLPNDDMKGRLIGKEGRNIKTLEAVTGVDLIIDDTPEVIVLSCFDMFRREKARVTIETLIKDGRIHPARIEEIYDKVSKEMNEKVKGYGEEALFTLKIGKMKKQLVEKLGKLHYRTSYGQNVLKHSIEVAELSGIIAGELGENVALAKRAGLLHDIGKSIDHDIEGSHTDLGAELAIRCQEPDEVIDAILSHHGDKEPKYITSTIVAAADAISASRPGARSDSLENYLQRLKDLENIGNSMEGIEKCYAIQAGREIRVIVKPDEVPEGKVSKLARDIKNKIEKNLDYPGTIKVTVIRETRVEEEAK